MSQSTATSATLAISTSSTPVSASDTKQKSAAHTKDEPAVVKQPPKADSAKNRSATIQEKLHPMPLLEQALARDPDSGSSYYEQVLDRGAHLEVTSQRLAVNEIISWNMHPNAERLMTVLEGAVWISSPSPTSRVHQPTQLGKNNDAICSYYVFEKESIRIPPGQWVQLKALRASNILTYFSKPL